MCNEPTLQTQTCLQSNQREYERVGNENYLWNDWNDDKDKIKIMKIMLQKWFMCIIYREWSLE